MHLLFGFDGRIPRSQYWLGVILATIITMVIIGILMLVAYSAGMFDQPPQEPNLIVMIVGGIIYLLTLIFALWASLAIQIKRWHDRNKSGWWWLIGLIPLVGSIWVLVECGCLRGTDGPNDYGPDPLEG